MVDNQHKKITGYRDLSEEEINLMNRVKQLGSEIEAVINNISEVEDIDGRWLAIGRTDLQKGIMSLVRSIAKPTSF